MSNDRHQMAIFYVDEDWYLVKTELVAQIKQGELSNDI